MAHPPHLRPVYQTNFLLLKLPIACQDRVNCSTTLCLRFYPMQTLIAHCSRHLITSNFIAAITALRDPTLASSGATKAEVPLPLKGKWTQPDLQYGL